MFSFHTLGWCHIASVLSSGDGMDVILPHLILLCAPFLEHDINLDVECCCRRRFYARSIISIHRTVYTRSQHICVCLGTSSFYWFFPPNFESTTSQDIHLAQYWFNTLALPISSPFFVPIRYGIRNTHTNNLMSCSNLFSWFPFNFNERANWAHYINK